MTSGTVEFRSTAPSLISTLQIEGGTLAIGSTVNVSLILKTGVNYVISRSLGKLKQLYSVYHRVGNAGKLRLLPSSTSFIKGYGIIEFIAVENSGYLEYTGLGCILRNAGQLTNAEGGTFNVNGTSHAFLNTTASGNFFQNFGLMIIKLANVHYGY